MSFSDPRTVFGIKEVTFYNKTTGEFYGPPLRVLGGSELNFTGEIIPLNGGCSKYPWALGEGTISAEISITAREYPNYIFELFNGSAPTVTAISGGDASTPVNKVGSSVIDAATGIDSITVSTASELKSGQYVIKATGAATADIFCSSTVDASASLFDDDLKVGSIDISVADAVLADFGLTFVQGSGTIAFVTNDTATFEVANENVTSETSVVVGGSSDTFPEFGAIVYGCKQGTSKIVEIDLYSVKALGAPIIFSENEFSEWSVTAQANYDSAKDGVYRLRALE